jgi:hypothetical protein
LTQLHLDPLALADLLSRLGIVAASNTCLEFYTATASCEIYRKPRPLAWGCEPGRHAPAAALARFGFFMLFMPFMV